MTPSPTPPPADLLGERNAADPQGIAKRLVLALALCSAVAIAAITAIELRAQYRDDLQRIDGTLEFIGSSHLPALAESAARADATQVQAQLDGLARLRDIEYVAVLADGAVRWSAGRAASQRTRGAEFPLRLTRDGQSHTVGSVRVVASVDRVLDRLYGRAATVAIDNGLAIALVAVAMLLLFQRSVSRHLTSITDFVRGLDLGSPQGQQLRLDRSDHGLWRPDALDAVAEALNGMSRSLTDAQAELRDSERHFRAIVEAQDDAVCRWLPDTTLTFANGRYRELFGLGDGAVVGRRWLEFVPEAEREGVARFYAELAQQPRRVAYEHSATVADGALRWLSWVDVPLFDEAGKLVEFQSVGRDITERKRMEDALRSSEARLSHLLQATPAVVYTARASDFAATFMSENVQAITGFSAARFLAEADFWIRGIHPDDAARMTGAFEQLFATGEVKTEYRFRDSNGRYRWMEDGGRLVRDAQGAPVEIVGYWLDITERKQAEIALRDSERRYREMFASNPHPMWVYDLETLRFLDVNDAAVAHYGWSREEFLAMTIADIRPADDVPRLRENIAQASEGGIDRAGIWRHRRRDGSLIEVEITSHALESGGRRAELVLANDITDQRRAERELKRSNRLLHTLTECNQVLVRATDERQLLADICGLIVESGGYRMCWIGLAEDEPGRSVRPVAVAGANAGYLDTADISWDDTPRGRGPTGVAIRERRPVVAPAVADDPRMAPWREAASARGFASSIALPLLAEDGRCFGALSLYSAEADAFDTGEIGFLTQLANDIAYGMRALRDRSVRVEVESQLRSTAERLTHLMQTSPIVLYSLRVGDGRLALDEVSENIERILGYPRGEALAPGWWREHLHPDDRADAEATIAKALATGQAEHEYRFRHRDGRHLWIRDSLRIVTDANGATVEAVGAWLDVSEKRRSEEDMRVKEAAMESSLAGIALADAQGRLTYVNPAFCRMWRVDEAQVPGTSAMQYWARPEEAEEVIRALLTQGKWSGEMQARRSDGTRFVAQLLASTVRDGHGEPLCLMGSFVDVTDSRQARDALQELTQTLEARVRERTAALSQATERAQQASRAKSEFLSRMSHELRTPLNAVLGFAQILELSNPTERQRTWAQEIRRAGDHLLELIEQLLDLSRIEVGRLPLKIEAQPVAPIVREAIGIAQPMIEARELQLAVEGLDEADAASVDATRLRQILVNFLSNAVKFSPPQGGRITVSCTKPTADRLRLTVTDTGIGIAADKLQGLFQPFERLGAEAHGIAGTGIGLALSKQLAELMEAEVGAESTLGEGSSFWVELRRAQGAPVRSLHAVPAPPLLTSAPIRLLYVEDNLVNLEVMRAMLAPYPNLKLLTTDDGAEAIEVARSHQPAMILLDIHMPKMDGFTVLARLRAHPQTRSIPVVAVTADAMPDEVERGLAAGFVRYLTKPVALQALLEVIAEYCPPQH
jgi:PAS domain S-box-containing protein